jgi:hypothetical protein
MGAINIRVREQLFLILELIAGYTGPSYPNRCYSYSQFCDRYGHWRGLQKRSMRQIHKAGEKCFVDYGVAEPKLSPSLRPCERVLHTHSCRSSSLAGNAHLRTVAAL